VARTQENGCHAATELFKSDSPHSSGSAAFEATAYHAANSKTPGLRVAARCDMRA